jgi:hypothetical protein
MGGALAGPGSHHVRRGEGGRPAAPAVSPRTRATACSTWIGDCRQVLPGRYSRGLTRVSLASLVMASFYPRCEIRQLAVYVYPGGIKAPTAERITVFYGRRGRPVKKPRFIPAERAHFWARKLQARRLGTVAVL